MLTKNQFNVLSALRSNEGLTSQANLADVADMSVGTVNSTLKALREHGWVDSKGLSITADGLNQLEPYRVDNAVIMAAGFSSHFAPLSYERPKGLLTVRGEVLIERQIRQLQEAGINDITVVVGYLKELFFYLEDKYGVKIVVNDEYSTRDNHSSLYRVRDRLSRTFICSSDNFFEQNVFEPYVYEAYYAGVYADGYTKEWCMAPGAHDVIEEVTIGGSDSWYMLGHVFFDKPFSDRMRQILEDEYDLPATRNKLWEKLYMEHIDEMRMVLRRYPDGVIYEFDSIEDMQNFDESFIDNVDSRILGNIERVLGCSRSDITDIDPIKEGVTNLSCRFRAGDEWYVYRHPGVDTNRFINRASETCSEEIACDLGLDETFVFEDPREGWKISRYVEDRIPFDYANPEHVQMAMGLARKLHGSGSETAYSADMCDAIEQTIGFLDEFDRVSFPDFQNLLAQTKELCRLVHDDGVAPCLCHNDFYAPNYLIHDGRVDLVDWEYSGMGDYAGDLGTFICCCDDLTYEMALDVLRLYFEREPSLEELRHCIAYIAIAAFRWYAWSLYQDVCGKPVGDSLYSWYRIAREYGPRALGMYGV